MTQLPGFRDVEVVAHRVDAVLMRATHVRLARTVAVKLLPGRSVTAEYEQQMENTILLSNRPHLLPIVDWGQTTDGHPYVVTDYCPDGSYADILARVGVLPPDETAQIRRDIGEALRALHQAGVAHGAVTLANIMRTPEGPRLTDLPIARATVEPSEPADDLAALEVALRGHPESDAPRQPIAARPRVAPPPPRPEWVDEPAAIPNRRRSMALAAVATVVVAGLAVAAIAANAGGFGLAGDGARERPAGNGAQASPTGGEGRERPAGAVASIQGTGGSAAAQRTPSAAASPARSSPAPVAVTEDGGPTKVRLADHGETVTLTWQAPKAKAQQIAVLGGPSGTQPVLLQVLGSTQTTVTLNGVNPRFDYCYVVVAVFSASSVGRSGPACTTRGTPRKEQT
jgi:serine/threonine protein kinase